MPRYAKPRRSPAFYLRVTLIPALALLAIAIFLYQEFSFRHKLHTTWASAPATAEDTRIRPITGSALEYGSKDLYEVEVLARYSLNNTGHTDWFPLAGSPQPQAKAQAEASAIKGKQLTLRWDPTSPNQKILEPN